MVKQTLKDLFPRLREEIDWWWDDKCRSAALLGAFDQEYGPRHPSRGEFISLLESEPDEFTKEMGIPLSQQLK